MSCASQLSMSHFLNQSVLQDGHKKDISSSTLMKNWDLRSEIFHELTLLLIAECIDQPGKQWSCNIRNFWASEIYYFHSTEQMKMVAAMCPFIEEVLFMFEVGWHRLTLQQILTIKHCFTGQVHLSARGSEFAQTHEEIRTVGRRFLLWQHDSSINRYWWDNVD